jgi:carbohydrate diacid regulator
MISNQILQKTLDGLHQISKMDFAIFDESGNMLVTTFAEAKKFGEIADDFAKGDRDSATEEGGYFYKVFEEGVVEYVVMVNGSTKEHDTMGRIACFQLNELAVAYRERFDKDNFVKNLLLDNLLLVDIYNRAKKLHIEAEARRVVMVVEIEGEQVGDEMERVRTVFGQKAGDFVTAVD